MQLRAIAILRFRYLFKVITVELVRDEKGQLLWSYRYDGRPIRTSDYFPQQHIMECRKWSTIIFERNCEYTIDFEYHHRREIPYNESHLRLTLYD